MGHREGALRRALSPSAASDPTGNSRFKPDSQGVFRTTPGCLFSDPGRTREGAWPQGDSERSITAE